MRARKPPRHVKAQHQGREDLFILLKCFSAFHAVFGLMISESKINVLHNEFNKITIKKVNQSCFLSLWVTQCPNHNKCMTCL